MKGAQSVPSGEAASRRGRTKARPRKRRNETLHYVVEIDDWDWSFIFGVSPMKGGSEGP